MKLLHRISLFIVVALVVLPLVIMAQDNSQPSAAGGIRIAQVATFDPGNIQPARSERTRFLCVPDLQTR